MYVVLVAFEIVEGAVDAFMEQMVRQAEASLREEPGCLQFDVCVGETDPEQVLLYEIYADRAAFEANLNAPHFAAFDQAVAPLVTSKTVGTFHRVET